MKRKPTCERLCEWVGATNDHLEFLALGNPNEGYENLCLTSFDNLLSQGNLLRADNRYAMQACCKKWNDALRKKGMPGHSRLFVHPEMAEFAFTIPSDRRRRK